MESTASTRVAAVALLMMALVAQLCSGHELTDPDITKGLPSGSEVRQRIMQDFPYGLSGCLVDCEAGLLECSFSCFFQAPFKCLTACLSPGTILDPTECISKCSDAIFGCLGDCVKPPAPAPAPGPAPGPAPPHPPKSAPAPVPYPPIFFPPFRPPLPRA